MSLRAELKRAVEHAKAFYDNGGIGSDYKRLHRAHWQTLFSYDYLDRIFKVRVRAKVPERKIDYYATPNLPQNWLSPLTDLLSTLPPGGGDVLRQKM